MPANLKELRNRIKSVKGTQKITKAMQLVSAAKFGRSQSAILNARPYANGLEALVKYLAYFVRGGCSLPLLSPNSSKTALVLVVSSDRGLCGGYNANIVKLVNKTWDNLEAEGYKVSFACIGKKAFHPILRRKRAKNKTDTNVSYKLVNEEMYAVNPDALLGESDLNMITTSFEKHLDQSIEPLADALSTLYAQQKIGKLIIIYSKFQSAMVQTPITNTVLPLSFISADMQATPKTHTSEAPVTDFGEPIFEPERDDLLSMALPRYMSSQILHMLLEAQASEYGARMTSMENATRNAKEIERKLQITYQRARQAAITNELIEIISGAEAL